MGFCLFAKLKNVTIYFTSGSETLKIFVSDNVMNSFADEGQFIARSKEPEEVQPLEHATYNQVLVDITTTFTILIGIFFPSVTGKISLDVLTLNFPCYYS